MALPSNEQIRPMYATLLSLSLTAVPHRQSDTDSLAAGGSGGSIVPKSIYPLLIRLFSYLNGTAKLHAAIRVTRSRNVFHLSSLRPIYFAGISVLLNRVWWD